MKKIILTCALLFCCGSVLANESANLNADSALQKLKEGNERFVKMLVTHPDETLARRNELVGGQHPFAVILACSDSRVPPEVVFDQGLGDVFVIRNAGGVIDQHVLGSLEYAVEHLGVNLVVVLGHGSCGAVGATMSNAKGSKYIKSIEKSIKPAVSQAKKEGCLTPENVTKDNAQIVSGNILAKSAVLRELAENKGLKVVPAYYYLDSGKVEFLSK